MELMYHNKDSVLMNRKYSKFANIDISKWRLWTIEEDEYITKNLHLSPTNLKETLFDRTLEAIEVRKNKIKRCLIKK